MRKTLLLLLCAGLLGGCASTRTSGSWQGPLAAPQPVFKHLYVIALTPLDAVAVDLEAALAEGLREAGIKASAARKDFSGQDLRDPAWRERIAAQVRARGADGVLLVAYVNSAEKQYYVPPTTQTVTVAGPWQPGWPAYLGYHYDIIFQPGYYTTSREYYMQSSLYADGREEPVWRAQSATVDPDTVQAGIRSFTRSLVGELRADGALAR